VPANPAITYSKQNQGSGEERRCLTAYEFGISQASTACGLRYINDLDIRMLFQPNVDFFLQA